MLALPCSSTQSTSFCPQIPKADSIRSTPVGTSNTTLVRRPWLVGADSNLESRRELSPGRTRTSDLFGLGAPCTCSMAAELGRPALLPSPAPQPFVRASAQPTGARGYVTRLRLPRWAQAKASAPAGIGAHAPASGQRPLGSAMHLICGAFRCSKDEVCASALVLVLQVRTRCKPGFRPDREVLGSAS